MLFLSTTLLQQYTKYLSRRKNSSSTYYLWQLGIASCLDKETQQKLLTQTTGDHESQPALMIKLLLQESKTSMKKLIILWESIQNNGYNRWVLLSFRPNSCSQNAKPRRPGSHEKWMWNMSSEVYGITGKTPHYKGIKSVDQDQK
jgi:hypothetical protein